MPARRILETFRCPHPEPGLDGYKLIANVEVDDEALKRVLQRALINRPRPDGGRITNRGPFRITVYEQRP